MAEQRGSPFIDELLGRLRRRMTGSIFKAFEDRPWYTRLPRSERDQVRELILGAISAHHEVLLDIYRSSVSDGVTNLKSVQLLEQIHADVMSLNGRSRRDARDPVG